jgi:hypothetical protein
VTFSDGVVTLGIPAYQAESFIDRTLRCARNQSYAHLRVSVSIDQSSDGTEEICREHAREDDRVSVVAHRARLGWVANVNHLLDTADTEFEGIYFHDDLIEPTFVERLVAALRSRPDAASAHCDVVLEDRASSEVLRRGVAYEGTATERLLRYLVDRERGSMLRSMVRRGSPAGRARMTPAAVVYEMALVAAGPAIPVSDPLYRRWTKRAGGLTAGLHQRPLADAIQALRFNAEQAHAVIDGLQPSAEERELLEFGLAIYMSAHVRSLETTYVQDTAIDLAAVLGRPFELELPSSVHALPDPLEALCTSELERVRRRATSRARKLSV